MTGPSISVHTPFPQLGIIPECPCDVSLVLDNFYRIIQTLSPVISTLHTDRQTLKGFPHPVVLTGMTNRKFSRRVKKKKG